MSVTSTDFEVIELEDMDFERPCTPWDVECGNRAEWLANLKCCGMQIPVCGGHKERWELFLDSIVAVWGEIPTTCKACNTQLTPLPLDYYGWVKL